MSSRHERVATVVNLGETATPTSAAAHQYINKPAIRLALEGMWFVNQNRPEFSMKRPVVENSNRLAIGTGRRDIAISVCERHNVPFLLWLGAASVSIYPFL